MNTQKYTTEEIQKQQKFNKPQADLYKRICTDFEHGNYQPAMTNINKLLRQLPLNGECLAMQALIKYRANQLSGQEAMKSIKEALRYNLRSATMWHLYGIVCRHEKMYEEALKAFKTMNNLDGKSLFLKRDLFCLQMQNADFEGAYQTRVQMLEAKKDFGHNWLCKSTAAYCCKKYDIALKTLDDYIKKFGNQIESKRMSDLYQYKATILTESKQFSSLLEFLKKDGDKIYNRIFYKETMCLAYIELNMKPQAVEILKKLISINVNNLKYHLMLMKLFDLKTKVNSNETNEIENTQNEIIEEIEEIEDITEMKEEIIETKSKNEMKQSKEKILIEDVDDYVETPKMINTKEKIEDDNEKEYRLELEQVNWLKSFYTEINVINTIYVKMLLFSIQSYNNEFQTEFTAFLHSLIVSKHTQIAKIIKSITDEKRSIDAYMKYQCAFTFFKEMSHAAKFLLSYKNHPAKEIKEHTNIIHLGYISFLMQQNDYEEVKEVLDDMKDITNEYEINQFELWRSKYFAKIGDYDMAIKQLHIVNKKLKFERHHNNTIVKYFLKMKDTDSADRYLRQHAIEGENDIQGYNARMYYAFACAHYEKKEYEKTIQFCNRIEKYFINTQKDMFDYHLYVYEKMNICAYLELLGKLKEFEKLPLKFLALDLKKLAEEQLKN